MLACYDLPAGMHRLRLRSTTSVEHDHAEIRRPTRVVRIFPGDAGRRCRCWRYHIAVLRVANGDQTVE
ncbi:MAG TPA: hypothetical protein VHG08_25990 [Longimicrobium sp.]|nr:hypothetical protein [Longimicrobium sp.]